MSRKSNSFEFGPFRLEARERRLTRDGHAIPLRGRVFDTLLALVGRHGCLVTKDELMTAVWPDSTVEETNLNHNICIIRRALGEKVTGQKYVETVPKQGYRFVAEVREVDDAEDSDSTGEWEFRQGLKKADEPSLKATLSASAPQLSDAAPDGNHRAFPAADAGWHQHQAIIPLLAALFLALAGYFGSEQLGMFHRMTNSRIVLAVLPFEDLTGDSRQAYVADGLSDEIILQLGRWNTARVGVIARTSSKVYQGTRKSIGDIGHELGVHYVVEGSVRRDEKRYRITVMLIRVKDQTHLWAASYNRTVDNVTALQVEIAGLVASEIGRRIDVAAEESRLGYPPCLGVRPAQTLDVSALSAATVDPPPYSHSLLARETSL